MATTKSLRDLTPRQAPRQGPLAGSFLLLAVAALGVGGLGVGGYMFLASKSSAPAVSDAVLSATGRRETAPADAAGAATAPAAVAADPGDRSWDDADLKRCDAEASDAAAAASQRKLAAVSADRVGLGAPDAPFVQRSAYLLCSARTKPLHLCESYWRDRLLDGIRSYAAEFAQVRQSAYWTKVSLAEQARTNSGPSQDALRATADSVDQTTRDVMKLNEEITAALRALVADGIIEKADFGFLFGFGVPPEIAALLGEGRAVRRVCG